MSTFHAYFKLGEPALRRWGVSCRSWREVRKMLRKFEAQGYECFRIAKSDRRIDWKFDRTNNRHELRALSR